MEWISVKDRLPLETKKVLFIDKEYGMNVGFYFNKMWSIQFRYDLGISKVTHWQELPEPPKKEE